jgi:hypothetical protein
MTRPLVLAFCAAFLLLSHAASAKPKVALTQIEGDGSGDVRDAVVEALEGGKELSLISGKEVNRAVDKLGDLADLTDKDLKKLATELEADAIVMGKLDKVGSSRTLKFRLFVHKKPAKGFTMSFKDAKSEKFRSLLHDKILDKIGAAAGSDADEEKPAKKKKAAGEDDEDPLAKADKPDKKDKKAKKAKADDEDAKPKKAKADDEDAKPKKAKADDEDAKPKKAKTDDEDTKPKKAKADDAEAKPAPSGDDDKPAKRADTDDDAAPRKAKKKVATSDDGDEVEGGIVATAPAPHAANRVAARVDVGVSVVQHSFVFNSKVFANQPKGPSLSPVPGARFEGELYPLAFSDPSSAAAGLGIGVDFDKTLKLNLTTINNTQATTVAVKQNHYSIGVRYRLAFGKTATSPTLTFGAGYGKRLFSPQTAGTDPTVVGNINRDTPTTDYTLIEPRLTFRLPVTKMVAFTLGGSGLIVTNAGPIQQLSSYGRAKVYGVEGGASIDVVLGSNFALRFAGEFVQFGYSFTGAGMLSNNLDGDPTGQDVGGLADRSIGGSATLAVLY